MNIFGSRNLEFSETNETVETLPHSLDVPETREPERLEKLEFGYLRSVELDADGITHICIFHEDPEQSDLWEIVE